MGGTQSNLTRKVKKVFYCEVYSIFYQIYVQFQQAGFQINDHDSDFFWRNMSKNYVTHNFCVLDAKGHLFKAYGEKMNSSVTDLSQMSMS